MSDHIMSVQYTTDDDGIWVMCTCGWEKCCGYSPTPEQVMTPVRCDSRKIGNTIKVYDIFNGYNNLSYTGEIVRITKKYIIILHPLGTESRYHRATGYIIGYSFPSYCFAIAPETSK